MQQAVCLLGKKRNEETADGTDLRRSGLGFKEAANDILSQCFECPVIVCRDSHAVISSPWMAGSSGLKSLRFSMIQDCGQNRH
jgi:hypothetical protein